MQRDRIPKLLKKSQEKEDEIWRDFWKTGVGMGKQ
jgi:hypothetical protein